MKITYSKLLNSDNEKIMVTIKNYKTQYKHMRPDT